MKISCIYMISSIVKPHRFYIGSTSKICVVAKGERELSGGFKWKYKEGTL